MPKKTSLLQYLMRTGLFRTAHDAEQAVRSGKVNVRQQTVTNPRHFFNPKTDFVFVDGRPAKAVRKLYFILNKPVGAICQKSKEEETIYGLLAGLPLSKEEKSSLFAVGRLDRVTEGLLIITNDGELSRALMQPDAGARKTYRVVSQRPLRPADARMLEQGVSIISEGEPYTTRPCTIKATGNTTFLITLTEGRKNQIKLMLDAVGNEVAHLKRLSIGSLGLGSLKPGELRQATKEEILSLCPPPSKKD